MSQITQMESPTTGSSNRDSQTYAIIGAAVEVHGELGAGFLESAYAEALALELTARNVMFRREVELPIVYKGEQLNCGYRADLICEGDIIVELKAMKSLGVVDRAQLINYLKATGLHRGLLLNFGAPRLEYKRLVR